MIFPIVDREMNGHFIPLFEIIFGINAKVVWYKLKNAVQ